MARKSVFSYRTPDFVNGPFVVLDNIFDLAPSDRFLVAVRPLGGFRVTDQNGLILAIFGPKVRFLLKDPGFRQWPVCSPRRYLRFDTIRSISSGRSAARRAVFRPPGRILARKSVFCYRAPDFVNGPFVALDDIFDLAPSDRFLNFLNQESYRVPKKSGPRKKVFGHFLLLDGYIWTETMLYDQGISLRRSGYPTCRM